MVPSIRNAKDKCGGEAAAKGEDVPQLRLGLIADVQYANIPDGKSYGGTNRYYRAAMDGLRRACDAWKEEKVEAIMQLGDVMDGFQKSKAENSSESALSDLMQLFDGVGVPCYATLGNHELYNLPRETLNRMLNIPTDPMGHSYYSVLPHPAWRMIVLDGYDISLLGWPEDHPKTALARDILRNNNPNDNPNNPEGLKGVGRRFVGFGGGLGEEQLTWLRAELDQAKQLGQRAMLFCHIPMDPVTSPGVCLLWDYEALRDLCSEFQGTVVATFAGHAHRNGYNVDDAGVHHLVLPSVVETLPGEQSYAVMDFMQDRVVINGVGAVEPRVLTFETDAPREESECAAEVAAVSDTVSVTA